MRCCREALRLGGDDPGQTLRPAQPEVLVGAITHVPHYRRPQGGAAGGGDGLLMSDAGRLGGLALSLCVLRSLTVQVLPDDVSGPWRHAGEVRRLGSMGLCR